MTDSQPPNADTDPEPNLDAASQDGSPDVDPENGSSTGKVSIGSLLSDSAVYGIAKIIDPAIGFLLLPIVTAILMPEDYGLISLFTATSHVMFTMCSLGVHQAFFRYFTEATSDDQRDTITNTSISLALLYWLAVIPFALWFATPISSWLFDIESPTLVYLLLAFSVVQTIDSIGCNLLQATGRAWSFLINSVFATIAVRSLAVTLIVAGAGAWGWITGETLGRIAATVMIVAMAMPRARLRINRQQAKKLSWYGVMLVPAMLSFYVMTITDKFLIRMLCDDPFAQVGLYTVGERIAGIMHMANFSMMVGWQRFAFRNMHEDEGRDLIGYGMYLYLLGSGYMLLGLMLLGDDLTHWAIASSFDAGLATILPLTLAAFVGGLANISDIGLHKRSLPHVISTIMSVSAVLNIALNFYVIPRYGIQGAAWATFACQSLRLVLIFAGSQMAFRVNVDLRRVVAITTLYVVAFAIGKAFDPIGWIGAGAIQSGILVAVPLAIWWLPILTSSERAQIRRVIAKVTGKHPSESVQ
ncbi:Polysaccharide biosynthesis protein [Rubripirellula lacrimiformis]|uniref:Polysaccharide biosynthesis protein n=1 Tax=Rubripirellula lacrimiformis TaxID=1930273 RepID=A0A517N8D8_9BACT|nr:oligosaccharide flippase family protein [Rubripirellula lacrimiformis]QDT03404.1 Polysaccharide biosynthesis protein [Rubripirellula lacrimiformis]